ncbi:MAG: LCP family protein [bacterium]|nr:LCP family protein [bacterium]
MPGTAALQRARLQARYRRRRQTVLISFCLLMGFAGASFGLASRDWFSGAPRLPWFSMDLGFHNLLIVGIDDSYDPRGHRVETDRARTDTILLVRLRPEDRRAFVLSIPRDTQVLVPGYGTEKINAAHALGGLERTTEVVESLTGVDVERTVSIRLSQAIRFLDDLGGVKVYVEHPMHYDDHTAKLSIHLEPGWHQLSGKEAVGYARFRHDALGDIGRVARQQSLIHAVQRKLFDPLTWWRLPALARSARAIFDTTITGDEILKLSKFAHERPSVSYMTLPGDFGHGGYWIPSIARIASVMEGLDRDRPSQPPRQESPATIEILHARGMEAAATALASSLGQKGLTVVRTAILPSGMSATSRVIGRNSNPTLDPVLEDVVPDATWQLSDDVSPYSADYTVVVGPDFR